MRTAGLALEARLLWRAPGTGLVIGLWTIVLLLALASGSRFVSARQSALAQQTARAQSGLESLQAAANVATAEGTAATRAEPVLAYRPRASVTLPPAPLSLLAIGEQDLQPYAGSGTVLTRPDQMLRVYQLQSATTLAAGRFDLAFVIVFLMPLLLLALVHGQLAEEIEQGRLAFILAQGGQPVRLLPLRIALRGLMMALPLIVLSLGATISTVGVGALGGWLAFMMPTLAYLTFWCCLAAAIAGAARSTGVAALRLAIAWLAITLVLPVTLQAAVDLLSPKPSRLAAVSLIRAAELDGERRAEALLGSYLHDHPELAAKTPDAENGWVPGYYARMQTLADAIASSSQQVDEEANENRRFAAKLAYFSPAAVVAQTLTRAALSDEGRMAEFQRQIVVFKSAFDAPLIPLMFSGTALTAQQITSLPQFHFAEPVPLWPWLSTLYLLVLAGLLAALARRRIRTLSPVVRAIV